MKRYEVAALANTESVVISSEQLRTLLYMADMLGSGMTPKGEMCFVWGKQLHEIVRSAEIYSE
jgi:hypothetical protein